MGNSIRKENQLSKREKKRLDNYNIIFKKLEKDGYEKKFLTISLKKANTISLLIPLPLILLFVLLYLLLGNKFIFSDFLDNTFLFVILVIITTIIHECLHGMGFAIFSKNHFKDIDFGFAIKEVTPYCTCTYPLKKYQYIISLLLPFIILGLMFCTISLFLNSTLIFIIGIVNLFGTSGDLTICLLILKNKSNKKDVLYYDHPVDCGVVMFDK